MKTQKAVHVILNCTLVAFVNSNFQTVNVGVIVHCVYCVFKLVKCEDIYIHYSYIINSFSFFICDEILQLNFTVVVFLLSFF